MSAKCSGRGQNRCWDIFAFHNVSEKTNFQVGAVQRFLLVKGEKTWEKGGGVRVK